MTAPDIIKDLKNRKYKPLYLLHGEEPYFIDMVSNYAEHKLLPEAERLLGAQTLRGRGHARGCS